jgi:hypothetical protein
MGSSMNASSGEGKPALLPASKSQFRFGGIVQEIALAFGVNRTGFLIS